MSTQVDGTTDAGQEPAASDVPGAGDGRAAGVVGTLRATVLRGDRPYVVGFLAALGLAIVVVSGPVRTWAEQRDLVDSRRDVLAAIEGENERLADRVEDLQDPATIEAQAREELGMYRPGEVPFVVIPPEVDQPQLRSLPQPEDDDPPSILERIRQALSDVFG